MDDCVHHIDICPDCDGLDVTRLVRMPGVVSAGSLSLDGGSKLDLTGATIYVGPARTPCDNPPT